MDKHKHLLKTPAAHTEMTTIGQISRLYINYLRQLVEKCRHEGDRYFEIKNSIK